MESKVTVVSTVMDIGQQRCAKISVLWQISWSKLWKTKQVCSHPLFSYILVIVRNIKACPSLTKNAFVNQADRDLHGNICIDICLWLVMAYSPHQSLTCCFDHFWTGLFELIPLSETGTCGLLAQHWFLIVNWNDLYWNGSEDFMFPIW